MPTANTRVLVIEDLKVAQIAAMSLFKRFDCQVFIVTNGAKALEQIVSKNFDILFIDLQLPDINGFELAQTIRSLQHTQKRLPLIAVTANSSEDLEAKTRAAGFDDFTLKPLTEETIRYMLNKFLKKSF